MNGSMTEPSGRSPVRVAADGAGDMGDFVTAVFTRAYPAAKDSQHLLEKALDVIGLQTARLHLLHLMAEFLHLAVGEHVMGNL